VPKRQFQDYGQEFCANFVVLGSKGIDIILGMGWLSKVDAVIQCAKRSVLLTSPEGSTSVGSRLCSELVEGRFDRGHQSHL
jgi:hypothetical protein